MVSEPTDTILNTSVTWADVEEHLISALSTEARLGPNKTLLDIGDGNGFMTCCGLITCDWVGGFENEQLPTTVVLKIPSTLPLRKLEDSLPDAQKMTDDEEKWAAMDRQITEIHNTEVTTYEFLKEFDGLAVPKCYFGTAKLEDQESGQLCLEYIANAKTMSFYEPNSLELLRQIAQALGKIQACTLKKEATLPDLNKDFFSRLAQMWPLEMIRTRYTGLSAFDSSEKTAELLKKIDDLVVKYNGSNLPTTIYRQMGFRPVLVNGDLHAGNVLIDKDTGNLAALIDWQLTHLGVGVEDLHRIAMSSLSTEERRVSMPILIEVMYDSLVENLDGAGPPYSLEKLMLISDLVFPQCAIFFTSSVIPLIMNMEKETKIAGDEKKMRIGSMLDKVIGTLEDMVTIDAKIEKHMEKLKLFD